MKKLFIEDLNVKDKKVLMRVDFNVPLDANGNITDDTRIIAALPSIRYIIKNGGIAILMSHLGRPKGKKNPSMSLAPTAKRLSELLGKPVKFIHDCVGPEAEKGVAELKPGDVAILENLRFYDAEEKNDPEFAKSLAKLGDIYVNDAFGTAHRAHASTEGVNKYFKQCATGYLMMKEIKFLHDELLENPKKPLIAILGGAKVSDKIGVVKKLLEKVDTLIIGGGMAYTFLKAQGKKIGSSICEDDQLETARAIIADAKKRGVNLLFPDDYVVADKFDNDANQKIVSPDGIENGWMGMDIGPKTIEKFSKSLKGAGTIFWNGPLGVFELPNFAKGTMEVAKAVADSGAVTVIGGGDSVSAINQSGLADKISHISTGGGASMEYLEKGELVGINALTDK